MQPFLIMVDDAQTDVAQRCCDYLEKHQVVENSHNQLDSESNRWDEPHLTAEK